ncbi:MAG TPA: response regulator [bacterium]
MGPLAARIRANLTAKIILFVCASEVLLLAVLGTFFLHGYRRELDRQVAEKMAVPAALMSQMALNFDVAADLRALEGIVHEPVVDAFVARRTGDVFFASDPAKIGRPAAEFVPATAGSETPGGGRTWAVDAGGAHHLALLAPLRSGGDDIGQLYLRIDAAGVAARADRALLLYVAGSAFAVALTLVITGFWVQRLFVPRIDRTVAVLDDVRAGSYAARVGGPVTPDQLGRLMQSVDAMIERIEAHLVALHRAEKEYRDLFDNAVEGIFQLAGDGRLLAANPALARMLGCGSTPEVLARFFSAPPEARWADLARHEEFHATLRERGEVRDFEARLLRVDGTVLWASLSGRMIPGTDGGGGSVECSVTDISERRRREAAEIERRAAEVAHAEVSGLLAALEGKNRQLVETVSQLDAAQAKLVRSEKLAAMGTMAAGVAHDLNNILSGLVGYPELLLMDLPADSPLREIVEAIRESGTRAAAVVADLLTLARGAAYAVEECDLAQLVSRYLQSPEHQALAARHPGVRLACPPAPGLRLVRCSLVHIQKVVMNLVMNAFEAIPGRGEVRMALANRAVTAETSSAAGVPPGAYVSLRVDDTGPGIPAGELARVFEPFYTKKVLGRSGTGLGLTVVSNTVQEHGGSVTVDSGASGASFTVLLPAVVRAVAARAASAPSASALARGTGRILVVDDERGLRDLARRMLIALGYTVETVSSGEEAIAWLRERTADLVLLDMLMPPGMNGCETYREIVKIRPGQKALICSGYAQSADYAEARLLGAGRFLKKPFGLADLGAAVRGELAGEDGAAG